MTEPFQNFDELRDLLDLLCEERLPAEQMPRLEHLVLAHPEAENRAAALVALCEAARFDRSRLADLLELLTSDQEAVLVSLGYLD